MSDQPADLPTPASEPEPPAPAPKPGVAFGVLGDGSLAVFMHLGQKVRSIFADNLERVAQRIEGIGISEFGMSQEDASGLAKDSLEAATKTAPASADAEHLSLLQDQLADTDKQLTEAIAAKLKAESDLALAQSEIKELKAALAKVSPGDVSPAVGAEVMGDPPEPQQVDTPPEQTTEPAAAPNTAAAGGETQGG